MKRIIIIGGGSSGLVCAIELARLKQLFQMDIHITIIEQKEKLGKKLLATGNGRCNLSNKDMTLEHYHGHHVKNIQSLIEQFDAVSYFDELGLWTKYMNNLLYPQSEQAISVLDIFMRQLNNMNVEIILNEKVNTIKKQQQFIIETQSSTYYSDYVILATGGDVASQFGSDGSGLKLLKSFGHHIYTTTPALVQFKCYNMDKQLKGVRIHGTFTLYVNQKPVHQEKGEVLFTDDGLSGISIMQMSRYFYQFPNCHLEVGIDALDQYSEQELIKKITQMNIQNYDEILTGIVNKKYAAFLNQYVSETKEHNKIKVMAKLLKDFRFEVSGTRGKDSAQVSSGGASLNDFNQETFESLKVKHLYAIGEVLDIDGDCGGYNLHFAFASACYVAKAVINQIIMEECYD